MGVYLMGNCVFSGERISPDQIEQSEIVLIVFWWRSWQRGRCQTGRVIYAFSDNEDVPCPKGEGMRFGTEL